MSTMRFGGYTNVSYEQATTGAEMMQEVIASMRASAGEEMVAIPRGIALVAGGFIASGIYISLDEESVVRNMTNPKKFWNLMKMAYLSGDDTKAMPLELDEDDERALALSKWSGHIAHAGREAGQA